MNSNYFRKIAFLSLLLTLFVSNIWCQVPSIITEFDEQGYTPQLDSLRAKYSKNKTIPAEIELQVLIALSYYPTLAHVAITFAYRNIFTTMACRPNLNFILRHPSKRCYTIWIDKQLSVFNINNKLHKHGILFPELSFNQQVGIIGHELAHIFDYENKNSIAVIMTGIRYISHKSYKIALEHQIDRLTIEHGLGWQIHDFCNFVLLKSDITKQYKDYKRLIYYSPEQLIEVMAEYPQLYKTSYLHIETELEN